MMKVRSVVVVVGGGTQRDNSMIEDEDVSSSSSSSSSESSSSSSEGEGEGVEEGVVEKMAKFVGVHNLNRG